MRYAIEAPAKNPTRFPIMPMYSLPSEDALEMHRRMCWELTDAEYYMVLFQPHDRAFVERCIPAPLKPVPRAPLVAIFVQQFILNGGMDHDSLNRGYLELVIAAMTTYRGKLGAFPLAVFIDSDIGAMWGREVFGTIKKVARFDYKRTGSHFCFKAIRRDITLAEVEGEIVKGDLEPDNVVRLLGGATYHIHQVLAPIGAELPYAYPPRLMQMDLGVRRVHSARACDNVKFAVHESPFDPICLFRPREIVAVTYLNADVGCNGMRTLEDLDPIATLPWLFSKFDPF